MMSQPSTESDRQLLREARAQGTGATIRAFVKLSGPGWLQSAITLGGGSLSTSLFLGVLGGFHFLWLQPMAIGCGVIMLSAISYVVLSTGERPFSAINRHINPVLGWGWAIATLMANMVWSLPQFSLATAAIQQNLLPGYLGESSQIGSQNGKIIIAIVLLVFCGCVVQLYAKGGRGMRVFDIILKTMVAIIVVSFFGVVVKLSMTGEGLPWGDIFSGFIPNLAYLSEPSPEFRPLLEQVASAFRQFWTDYIVNNQRSVMIGAAATAVGINMTFLMPYAILSRGWDKDFRGMAIFDLATGMAIPYVLVTGCVIVASATQFHTKPGQGLMEGDGTAPAGLQKSYAATLKSRLTAEIGADQVKALDGEELAARIHALPEADRRMAAMLVKRDAFGLADALSPLTGNAFAQIVFGVGVLGMGISTIIILMLISGFVICEMLGIPPEGTAHRLASLAAGVGVLGPFFWQQSSVWLAVPTSVFGMTLLPIAYFTFMLMMNEKQLMGEAMPRGGKRVVWNVLMAFASLAASIGAGWSIWSSARWTGVAIAGAFLLLAVVVQFARKPRPEARAA